MEHPSINNSDPRIIAMGLFIAVICGILGAVVVIHFRDIADRDNRKHDHAPHSDHSGSYTVGGYSSLFVCIFLGCISFFLLQNEPRRMELSRQVSEAFKFYSSKNSSHNPTQHAPMRVYSDEWVNHQWTADEAPYRQIRNELDAQMSTDKESSHVERQAIDAAFHDKNNPLAMYRWGYVAYKLAYEACYHSTSKQQNETTQGGRDARQMDIARAIRDVDYQMQRVPNPQSYSYSRLLFLLKGMKGLSRPFVPPSRSAEIKQGEYLVNYKPDDWDVKQTLARMLATRRDEMSSARAIDYTQEVIHARPQSPQAWQTLGMVYVSRAEIGRRNPRQRNEDAATAIEMYQKCLQLAPPDYGPRERLENAIITIRTHPHLWITQTKYR